MTKLIDLISCSISVWTVLYKFIFLYSLHVRCMLATQEEKRDRAHRVKSSVLTSNSTLKEQFEVCLLVSSPLLNVWLCSDDLFMPENILSARTKTVFSHCVPLELLPSLRGGGIPEVGRMMWIIVTVIKWRTGFSKCVKELLQLTTGCVN